MSVDLERIVGVRRTCERCADRKAEYDDGFHEYTLENVSRAKDERAQEMGEQRNLAGEYRGDSDGHD